MQISNSNTVRRAANFFFICLLIFLTGCINTPRAVDGQELKPGQGLLVLRITSNVDARLGFLDYSATSTFQDRFSENMAGPKGYVHANPEQKYVVIPLDAGEYMWSKIEVYPKYAWLQSSNRFKVTPNSITYIGDIQISATDMRFSMRVTDGEREMRDYFAVTYPAYLKSMPVVKSLAELRLR